MRLAFICLLVLVSMLYVGARDCNDNSVAVYVTDEGNIRWRFSGVEMLPDGGLIHTICGLKCDCFNKVYLCCSDVDCLQMDHKCPAVESNPNPSLQFLEQPEMDLNELHIDPFGESGKAQTFEDALSGGSDQDSSGLSDSFLQGIPPLSNNIQSRAPMLEDTLAQGSNQESADLANNFIHGVPDFSDSELSESGGAQTFEDAMALGSDQGSSDLSNNFIQGIPQHLDHKIVKTKIKAKRIRKNKKKKDNNNLSLNKLFSG